jgi:hypothetical protein
MGWGVSFLMEFIFVILVAAALGQIVAMARNAYWPGLPFWVHLLMCGAVGYSWGKLATYLGIW